MTLWKYKNYILYSMKARLVSETINSHLGGLWLILEPLLRMVIYYVVFVYFIKTRTEDFVSFLLVGIIAFLWFSKTVLQGGNSIRASGGLIKQIHMPKVIFPTIVSLVRGVEFFIVLGVLMTYFAITGQIFLTWISVPLIITAQFLLTYGVTLVTAGITPFIPDISYLIGSILTGLLFLSGTFFEVLPSDPHYDLFMLNPLAKLLEQYRQVILYGNWPDWGALLIIGLIGLFLIVVMTWFIERMDCYYPRLVQ